MIAKKNKKANLERKRFAFFQIGLLVSGSLVLAAFEYSTVSAEEKKLVFQDFDETGIQPEPAIDDPLKPMEEKKPAPTIVNLEHVDSFKITKKIIPTGSLIVTTSENITIPGGDGDPFNITDWGLDPEELEVLPFAEKEPEFVGGDEALFNWLQGQIVYPAMCAEMGLSGTTYVQFVVNTDGSICKVKDAGSPHEDFTKEALRVVKKMPKWIPGEQAGKKVRVSYTLPIQFTLH